MARCYPRVAASIPYQVAFAVVPLTGIRHCRGALLLMWSPGRSPVLSRRERGRIMAGARRIARVLDLAALPPSIPDRPRFVRPDGTEPVPQSGSEAARQVERLPLGTLDVQGHDMAAAALMGQVRMAVHAHATAGATPDQVLTRTDRDLADLNAGRFVSCLYAHLDLARHRATLAGGGHPPPLLRAPDGRTHPVDIRPGPPLGIGIGTPAYPLTTLSLGPETLLALYTDGLVEDPGTDIGRTIADLAHHLGESGDLPLHRLVDDLVHHTHRTGRHTDDIALLLLRPRRTAEP
ncbi:PP2C family protein-serine/threonine phosphatase [Streptomyces sp. SP18BB07]|uniref:PP2C family protein-serine/threonine phosphatase n=1 Tax=Streptomyces sp. SP18BB07 TaxID=3002522 RepID=UPI003FCE8D09